MSANWIRVCLVAAALIVFPGGSAAGDSVPSAPRVVAVGDIHGDYDAFRTILSASGVSESRGRWTGGDTILVQMGDLADRGPDSRKIIRELQRLQKRAAKQGGKVIVLVGNHEAMNMTGDLRYVHPGEYEAFKDRNSERRRAQLFDANRELIETSYLERDPSLSSDAIREAWYAEWPLGRIAHQRAWAPDGEIGSWVAANPSVVLIGDSLFVHAGLSAEYAGFSANQINARVSAALSAQDGSVGSVLYDELGPLWYRGNIRRKEPSPDEYDEQVGADAAEPRPSMQNEIAIVLAAYDAKRLIVGHTPSLEGVRASLGGRVIQIDTGASAYYGGPPAYLVITGDTVVAHNVATGESKTIVSDGSD